MPDGTVRERLLVVGDDTQVRDVLARTLGHEGYRCTLAADIADALSWLRRAPYDLIVCDVRLPDGSGLDLVEHSLPVREQMAALMISGLDEVSLAERALQLGACGYIVKPFSANDVLIGVLGALRHKRTKRDLQSEQQTAYEETIQRLCIAVESRDPGAAPHIAKMSGYCWRIARELELAPEACELHRAASTMHDVGNVAIADRILLKPGALTPSERAEMERHAEMGYRTLAGSRTPLLRLASSIAWTHHERFDGSGYPRGLVGEEIPLEGRIAAVADVFVALGRDRAHRPPHSSEVALEMMERGRGTAFDSAVLDALFAVHEELATAQTGPEVGVRASARDAPNGRGGGALSPRELQVLQLAADGHSVTEIAEVLTVSSGTIKSHFQHIYAKLAARDRVAAVATGLRRGLIE
ncbi:MAG TPA: HD domain-containing phosphohydrolase [Baekduia sp.]|nr:HD domain-containing phosphohydrolase [Baekduia sp.]